MRCEKNKSAHGRLSFHGIITVWFPCSSERGSQMVPFCEIRQNSMEKTGGNRRRWSIITSSRGKKKDKTEIVSCLPVAFCVQHRSRNTNSLWSYHWVGLPDCTLIIYDHRDIEKTRESLCHQRIKLHCGQDVDYGDLQIGSWYCDPNAGFFLHWARVTNKNKILTHLFWVKLRLVQF